jgi:DNA-binding transcriptional LysR family regulator
VLTNIDLRLLRIIAELSKTRSVAQTAENLELSPSAISMSLARLRKHFNDPLFVRTSGGMRPTPYAVNLIDEVVKAIEIIQGTFDRRSAFDPLSSDRMFRIYSTDIAEFTIFPLLLTRLRSIAPHVRIDVRNIAPDLPQLLESGEADLAIGVIPQMGGGFCRQKLFNGRFVCAMRADHPRIGNRLTREQFESETHLSVTTNGTGYEMLEKTLESLKIRRKVGMRVPSFLGVAGITSVTDYLTIMKAGLGEILADGKNMKLLPLPFDVPEYTVTQNWHERFSLEPGHQWIRTVLAGMFKGADTVPLPRTDTERS